VNRRTFIKVLGSVGAAVSAPTFLAEATERIPAGAVELGLIRETVHYEVCEDVMWVRHDVLCARTNTQITVGMKWFSEDAQRPEYRAEQREIAKSSLEREMRKQSISWHDLTPLPIPQGYKAPTWQ
jgi:hypothetical protein